MGEGVRGVIPLPHQGPFALFKISDLAHTLGEYLKYCLSPSSIVGTDATVGQHARLLLSVATVASAGYRGRQLSLAVGAGNACQYRQFVDPNGC